MLVNGFNTFSGTNTILYKILLTCLIFYKVINDFTSKGLIFIGKYRFLHCQNHTWLDNILLGKQNCKGIMLLKSQRAILQIILVNGIHKDKYFKRLLLHFQIHNPLSINGFYAKWICVRNFIGKCSQCYLGAWVMSIIIALSQN